MGQQNKFKLAVVLLLAISFGSCAKKSGKDTGNLEKTSYEIHCGQATYPPPETREEAPALPETLPVFMAPIEVNSCSGLGEDGPHFNGREMPGFVAIVDCNAKLVRFRTRDWQVNEAAGIGPMGDIDLRVMYITRLANDVEGNANCWTRLLGHIQGKVQCGASPSDARLNFTSTWTIDMTPPEIMEPPTPGMADKRNGKHCKVNNGNCTFTNTASAGCGG